YNETLSGLPTLPESLEAPLFSADQAILLKKKLLFRTTNQRSAVNRTAILVRIRWPVGAPGRRCWAIDYRAPISNGEGTGCAAGPFEVLVHRHFLNALHKEGSVRNQDIGMVPGRVD